MHSLLCFFFSSSGLSSLSFCPRSHSVSLCIFCLLSLSSWSSPVFPLFSCFCLSLVSFQFLLFSLVFFLFCSFSLLFCSQSVCFPFVFAVVLSFVFLSSVSAIFLFFSLCFVCLLWLCSGDEGEAGVRWIFLLFPCFCLLSSLQSSPSLSTGFFSCSPSFRSLPLS